MGVAWMGMEHCILHTKNRQTQLGNYYFRKWMGMGGGEIQTQIHQKIENGDIKKQTRLVYTCIYDLVNSDKRVRSLIVYDH